MKMMDKHDWIKLGICLFLCLVSSFFCYQWGYRDSESKHKVTLQKSTENIKQHEANKKEILTEPDSAAIARAYANLKRAKR